jgi:hypothetical protein
MASLIIPDQTYEKLVAIAAKTGTSPETLALQEIEKLIVTKAAERPYPTPEERKAAMDRIAAFAKANAHKYPPGFEVDDSRETIYGEGRP